MVTIIHSGIVPQHFPEKPIVTLEVGVFESHIKLRRDVEWCLHLAKGNANTTVTIKVDKKCPRLIIDCPCFWVLLAVVTVCIAGGAGYFIRRWLASKEKGSKGIPPRNIGTGEQREETCGNLPAGDNVEGRLLVVTPATPTTPTTPATPQNPQTPTPPKRKRRLTSSNLSSASNAARNGFHGLKEPFGINSAAGVAGLSS
ncbi:hypothetical protein N7455_000026 [Penicillium solitum]|uniref:uncharacterized protein n=1 Tax=Penicillium solitum TaxID=60172 RepID=UPI0032C401E9|nr:hypothetical protein N7455_000026 [Penicillium solitum]